MLCISPKTHHIDIAAEAQSPADLNSSEEQIKFPVENDDTMGEYPSDPQSFSNIALIEDVSPFS